MSNSELSVNQKRWPHALVWREMSAAELPRVLQIERNTQAVPWSRLAFEESLTRRESSEERAAHSLQVLCKGETILAFFVVSNVADETHLLNLAVDSPYQGRGFGHLAMREIIDYTRGQNSKKLFLEVRASNLTAQALYKKWQFEQIAVRKNYYRTENTKREDALVFIRVLDRV